jgi:uncharacterized membrane protein YhaH (DUF805 family)
MIKRMWNGRISQQNYLLGGLLVAGLPILVLLLVLFIVIIATDDLDVYILMMILFVVAFLWGAFVFTCLTIRRCHDFGRTGWLAVTLFIPFVGIIPGLIFLAIEGNESANKYGSAPTAKKLLADVFNY